MFLSFVLFLIGILTTNNRTRKKVSSLFVAILSFILLLLTILYLGVDYFTDEGINDAVIYHALYGVDNAGIAEYYDIIVIIFVLFLLSFIFSYFHYRFLRNSIHVKPQKIKAIISKTFLLAALISHPTMYAFWKIYQYENINHNDTKDLKLKEKFSDHYQIPTIESITENHPNFIYIYAESFERTYFDQKLFPGLITGLRELETNNTSFLNIEQVSGTGWTIAGMLSSQCGLPLVTPSGGNSMAGMDTFYSGATCIGDLLKNEGYYLSMMQGSSIEFSGIQTFFKTHNFDEVLGKLKLLSKLDDKSYLNYWGLYDDSLFDIAFHKFEQLSKRKKNFGLFLATLDTHHPNGYQSKECENVKYKNGSNSILNAVHCSDMQISNFVHKIQQSPYGKNTVIIISSDHLSMKNTATNMLNKGKRKNMFIIINPYTKTFSRQVVKEGSVLDIGPTALHSLGFKASLGLGRNLLSEDNSLSLKLENFNDYLKRWNFEINKFWNFKKIDNDITMSVFKKKIYIGDQSYNFPVLFKIDKKRLLTPFFELDSPKKLYEYLIDFDNDDAFLWLDACKRISLLDVTINNSEYCIVLGNIGGKLIGSSVDENTIIPLEYINQVNKEEPDEKLSQTRKETLLKLSNGSEEGFYQKVYRKLLNTYQKLKFYYKSLDWKFIENTEKPSKEEYIIGKNKSLYYADKQLVNRFIAHAGGEIDGYKYMNALEALDQNYKKGFRLFELDIIKTKDNVYVAAHDWKHWSEITGYNGALPPTLNQFKKYKIKNKFSPLDINAINDWFKVHTDAVLVTDKVNTPSDFAHKFIDKKRLIMELFTWNAVNEGIQEHLYAAMPTWSILSELKGDIVKKLLELGITHIAASRRVIHRNKDLMEKLHKNGIRVYVFHVNHDVGKDESYVVCNESSNIYGLYADKWDFNLTVNCDQVLK